MEHDYRIENLASTFDKHAQKIDKLNEEMLRNLLENYPSSEIPSHMNDPFNIARALSVMACEIDRLKQICK